MKLLRNPIAVAILAVLAVVVMGFQFWPMIRPRFARKAAPPPPPAPIVAPSTPPKPRKPPADVPAPAAAPSNTVEIAILEANSSRWIETPRNDPFKVRFYISGTQGTNSRPAMEVLTLNAIWQQNDGAPLAVINNRLLGEGDVILQFRISAIEPDRVWVDGPNGRERIRFKLPTPLGEEGDITLEKEVRVTPKSGR